MKRRVSGQHSRDQHDTGMMRNLSGVGNYDFPNSFIYFYLFISYGTWMWVCASADLGHFGGGISSLGSF